MGTATQSDAGSADVVTDHGRIAPTPGIPRAPTMVDVTAERMGGNLTGPAIGASFNEAPLPVFINEIFHERLGFSFHIEPGLREQTDLVTLRLTEPVPPKQLFDTARRVLRSYGVDIVEEEDGMLSFAAGEGTDAGDIPLLVTGRTLPEVPATHRDIFQLVPLHVATPQAVRSMLARAFANRALSVEEDFRRTALLLRGNSSVIARALAMIEVLDQPLLRGQFGLIIEPQFVEARKMASDLVTMLRAEGYNVSSAIEDQQQPAVLVLALESINKLVAFASDRTTLDHLQEWAALLDEQTQEAVDNAWFTYQVQHAKASELAGTLRQMLSGGTAARREVADDGSGGGSLSAGAATGGRVVADEIRNMLLFRGSGREWAQLRTVLQELDRAVPLVLVEAVIAEISLTDQDGSGIEFLARAALDSGRNAQIRTLDALGVQANALSLTVDSAGNTRALLNLFYQDSRVLIRSRPRVVVGSGEQANFDSGNEIPAIVQIADSGVQADGNTSLLQQVQYRQTGITLQIEPTAQPNGTVDLDISLELSEARPTAATSLTGTPTILRRGIDTKLTLRDGGSTVMGGLISDNKSVGQTGVPGIGRVPVLGRLFRTDSYQQDRTELIIMVIAYVMADHEESEEMTERLKEELELHRRFSE